jgi:hypothetical protein
MYHMQQPSRHENQETLEQLKAAEAELNELKGQLNTFETQVDAQLGTLLDQLSELNAETAALDATLRHIRERRLYGADLMHYLDGAPQPAHKSNLTQSPPLGLADRAAIHAKDLAHSTASEPAIPDIKVLYRKLARRHHPDLARNKADRQAAHEQMAEINQAYQAGDIKALMRLAGMWLPYGMDLPDEILSQASKIKSALSEQEQARQRLKTVRMQIDRLSNLPMVKLSLEVKLARHQGRNLLHEMAADLQYKVARKLAERDYLKAQINTSGDISSEENLSA